MNYICFIIRFNLNVLIVYVTFKIITFKVITIHKDDFILINNEKIFALTIMVLNCGCGCDFVAILTLWEIVGKCR